MKDDEGRLQTEAEKQSFPARANKNVESTPKKHNRCLEWAENSCRKGLEDTFLRVKFL